MLVKIFTDYDEDALCKKINNWVVEDNINVLDMKYSNVTDNNGQCFYTILVMYTIKYV